MKSQYIPAVFIIICSLVNYLIITDFSSSPVKLPIGLAKASGVLKNDFIIPTTGLNWGRLHGNNGVDIADTCGKMIYAPKAGMVIKSINDNQWNDGYGNFVWIKHLNGVITKYAHTKNNLVKVGDYVLQGDPIALIGNTGEVRGETGCHLHFEVEGAVNPFVTKK